MIQTSESVKAIAAALAKAQGEIENAHKTSTNPHFRSTYADLAEIINTVRPVLTKHGLAVVQLPGWEDGIVTVDTLLTHESGEWVRGTSGAPATKADPQGVGSAVTYLRRYSLAALCGIAQEDDDGNGASTAAGNGTAKKPAAKKGEASDKQVGLIQKLMKSSVITDSERKGLEGRLGRGMDKDEASKAIDWLTEEIDRRKATATVPPDDGYPTDDGEEPPSELDL